MFPPHSPEPPLPTHTHLGGAPLGRQLPAEAVAIEPQVCEAGVRRKQARRQRAVQLVVRQVSAAGQGVGGKTERLESSIPRAQKQLADGGEPH